MRFDIIIGNPPYQLKQADSRNTKLLYTEFVYKARELGDHVLFVLPSNYLTGNKGPLKTFRKFIKNNGLVEISEDKSEYFNVDTAGISVLHLNGDKKDTFIYDGVEIENDFTDSKIVVNQEAYKLYDRLCSGDNKLKCFRGKRGIYKGETDQYSETKTNKFPVPMFLNCKGGEPVVVYVEPDSKMDVAADHFALITQDWNKEELSFNKVWHRDDKMFTSNLNFIYFLLNEDETFDNFLTYTNSKVFKFLLKMADTGSRALPIGSLKKFPAVDLTRSWTDVELYELFNLSDENVREISEAI